MVRFLAQFLNVGVLLYEGYALDLQHRNIHLVFSFSVLLPKTPLKNVNMMIIDIFFNDTEYSFWQVHPIVLPLSLNITVRPLTPPPNLFPVPSGVRLSHIGPCLLCIFLTFATQNSYSLPGSSPSISWTYWRLNSVFAAQMLIMLPCYLFWNKRGYEITKCSADTLNCFSISLL